MFIDLPPNSPSPEQGSKILCASIIRLADRYFCSAWTNRDVHAVGTA